MARWIWIALSASLVVPAAVPAREMAAAADCPAQAEAIPPALAGWTSRVPLNAATRPHDVKAATITPGQAIDATLGQTSDVTYLQRPEKPGGSVSFGGLFAFTIAEAGTYRVALGAGAWIDLLKGKTAIISSAHGHGPTCSGIRKMVDFPLTPGHYVLQIAANGSSALPILLTRLP